MKICVLLIGLLAIGQATAQELLCPETGIPMSQDPGCMTPNYNEGAGNQQAPPAYGYDYVPPPLPDDGWVDTYGAVAFGIKPGHGPFYWFAGSNRSSEEANSQALGACSRDGAQGCMLGGTALNGFLGVAMSDDGSLFASYGAREDNVDFAAVGKCKYEGRKEGCRFLKAQNFSRRRK